MPSPSPALCRPSEPVVTATASLSLSLSVCPFLLLPPTVLVLPVDWGKTTVQAAADSLRLRWTTPGSGLLPRLPFGMHTLRRLEPPGLNGGSRQRFVPFLFLSATRLPCAIFARDTTREIEPPATRQPRTSVLGPDHRETRPTRFSVSACLPGGCRAGV